MNLRKKVSLLTLIVVAIVSLSIGVFADNAMIKIQGYIDKGMTITYNEEVLELTDAQDSKIYPVMIEGSTYLPVRAISETVGLEVGWDGDTKTVSLSDTVERVEKKEEQEVSNKIANKEAWSFAEGLMPTGDFTENHAPAEVIKSVYENLPNTEVMYKLQYTRIDEDGEVGHNTNYIILEKETSKYLMHKVYSEGVAFALTRDYPGNTSPKFVRVLVDGQTHSNTIEKPWKSSGFSFDRITPKGVVSYTLTNAWGDVVESK